MTKAVQKNPTDFVILDELRDLLDDLRETEFAELKKSIEEEGMRDPIIIWDEKNAIVDGHNRYKVAKLLGIEPKFLRHSYDTIDEVKEWMIRNQLGRRNLTRDRFDYYIGKLYNESKKDRAEAAKIGENQAEKIGKQYGVSEKTVRRAGETATGIDKLEQVKGKLAKMQQLSGKGEYTAKELTTVAKTSSPAVAKRVLDKIDESKKKQKEVKTAATKAVKEQTYPVAVVEPAFAELGFSVSTQVRPPLDKDAILYMICPDEYLDQAIKLVDKWGLEYDGCFILKLPEPLEGVWSKVTHSFMIVATRGVVTGPKVSDLSVSTLNGNKSTVAENMEKLVNSYHPKVEKLAVLSSIKIPQGWTRKAS